MNSTKISVFSVMLCCAGAMAGEEPPLFDVPRLDGIIIDGDASDWGGRGFEVRVMTTGDGQIRPAADLDTHLRLGWNDEGLLVCLTVHDDTFREADKPNDFWEGDSVTLFVGDAVGGKHWWQTNIVPGMDPKRPELRYWIFDRGKGDYDDRLKITAARKPIEGGYVMEAMLPWTNVPLTPELGREIAFQIYVTDVDKDGGRFVVHWYPQTDSHANTKHMHRLRLAETASAPVCVRAEGSMDASRVQGCIRVTASGDLAGRKVVVAGEGREAITDELKADGGRATATLYLPLPAAGQAYPTLTVTVGDELVNTIALGAPDRWLGELLVHLDAQASPAVFDGEELPKVSLGEDQRASKLLGEYKLDVAYYDAAYNVVTTASRPGRYAAVASVTKPDGRVYRRFLTLYRSPVSLDGVGAGVTGEQLGIPKVAADAQPHRVEELLQSIRKDGLKRDGNLAVALAGLAETPAADKPDDWYGEPDKIDRQWWVGLKRKLYGWDQRFPNPIVRPTPIEGAAAPVVHEGTLAEAGMKPDAVEKLDAVLKEWEANSGEPFAVCIVRNGVVVLHKAYGTRDGGPMTVDTRSWMASTTKFMSASMFMMAVDQGLLSLDDPAENYLPPLKGTQKTPWTFRNLYTHTDDLDWHWGSQVNDMEERIAALAPLAKVGKQYRYNGTGLELACKALEAASGEAMPNFYRHHLLGPLGMTNTRVDDACGGSNSVPMDMAKFGQMMLNGGAYGGMRFLRPETIQQMMPRSLHELYGFETEEVYGIGTTYWPLEPLGKGTFAHGAASGATLRVDPVNHLVISMTRNTLGMNYDKNHAKFLQAVVDAMEAPQTTTTTAPAQAGDK